ncbi:MAG TPA: site-2 protease family protein [Verrucomicrobiae bacterium]|jgi:membrane-associated protease RseP (regulator of RpoE activity)|nr:site-2 protease family protein [Verrucomicrobiae bacterium]
MAERISMNGGNGQGRLPVEILEMHFPALGESPPPRPRRRPLWPALILFLLTVVSTLAVGSEFARSYAHNEEPFSGDLNPLAMMLVPLAHPGLLRLGIPFSFTLLAILFAHEMGHYIACKIYGIDVSYPYFIPAPTLFGTFGAFIRIRSPIATRRALFDVGLAGPVVGFLVAFPAMAYAIAASKIVPGVEGNAAILFGNPPLMRLLFQLFHPRMNLAWLLLNPVGRAAWVGLFATALNLLPVWQLDGGHIVYSLANKQHQRISIIVALGLLMLARYSWWGWYGWGGILLILSLRFRHPPLVDRWEALGASRRLWALVALLIFILCFTPWVASNP